MHEVTLVGGGNEQPKTGANCGEMGQFSLWQKDNDDSGHEKKNS